MSSDFSAHLGLALAYYEVECQARSLGDESHVTQRLQKGERRHQ